ncbi:MAG: hypothetical protein WCJ64_02225 [Rhodospirillaceae bacterium]
MSQNAADDGIALLKESRDSILSRYVEALGSALKYYKIPLSDAEVSQLELSRAIDESELDLSAMMARRTGSNGISPGKIAGIIAFRLTRFAIVHLSGTSIENKLLHMVQPLAALMVVYSVVLRKVPDQSLLRELCYQLSRRHANQETLGAIFDLTR